MMKLVQSNKLLGLSAGIMLTASAINSAYALDTSEASDLVKRYSETVACQLEPTVNYEALQYKAVKLTPTSGEFEEGETRYVVIWQGDLGCAGGEASRMINFSVVQPGWYENLPAVVSVYMEFPDTDLIDVTAFEGQDGKLLLSGLTFGESDVEEPTQQLQYLVELTDGMLVATSQ